MERSVARIGLRKTCTPILLPVKIEYWRDVPGIWEDHHFACEMVSVIYYPQCHMIVLDGMLMGIFRPWLLSVGCDSTMMRLFREYAMPRDECTRHLITKLWRDGCTSIWLNLDPRDGRDSFCGELGFWICPWDLRAGGSVFIPDLVRKLQGWVRRCLRRKRRRRVMVALERARIAKEDNWLDLLPMDLLERGVLARL